MKKAFAVSVPARNPHVSRFASVFLWAILKKVVRNVGGRKMVRSGVPFSRYAAGAKVCAGSGVADREADSTCVEILSGRGGGAAESAMGLGGIAGGGIGASL